MGGRKEETRKDCWCKQTNKKEGNKKASQLPKGSIDRMN